MTRDSTDETIEDCRQSIELDGPWEFLTDPDNSGRTNQWYKPDVTWPVRSHVVDLPQAWQEDEDYRDYTGTVWYRRTVDLDHQLSSSADLETESKANRSVQLVFDAVDYETTVWVNGERVGENRGGYLPFEFDITDALSGGENVIVLAVTDPEDLSEIPHGKQGDPWYTRISGVWQSIRLEIRPETQITDARIKPDLDRDRADVDIAVDPGPETPDILKVTVEATFEGTTKATATVPLSDDTVNDFDEYVVSTATLEFDDPTYWHPDDPALYDVAVILKQHDTIVDRYEDYFGMRSFKVRNGEFLLNGDPITIRGVLEQGYYPETLYRLPDEWTYETEIEQASELGFNLIRKHLKPAHPDFLECADREGMLVWQEPANPMRYTDRSRVEVRQQLDGLISRDYNRPSVVIWSLYNEEWGIGHYDADETLWTDKEKQRFLADCYQWVRERDPTRVVCDNSGWAHVATDINDYHRYFVSPDQADKWAADLDHICHYPEDNYATNEYDDLDAPIVVSELGTWGLCDVDSLRERYDVDPHWFDHDFHVKAFKRPKNVDNRFKQTNLSDVFDGYADLATAWQEREFTSLKHLIEELRVRDEISGYVLTELTDIEWEFNGLLDYHRDPKSFVSDFSEVNSPISVVVQPQTHVVWSDQSVEATLTIVNDTSNGLSGTLKWALDPQQDMTGEIETGDDVQLNQCEEVVTVPAHGTVTIDTAVSVPETSDVRCAEDVQRMTFSASFTPDSPSATVSTTEPITVVSTDRGISRSSTVYAEGTFASRLAETGTTVTHTLSDDVDIAVTREITNRIKRFASDGGAVLHVPDHDGEMRSGGPFSYRSLPRNESWNITAGFYYQDSPILEGLCPDRHLGWEFEDLYPHSVATELNPSIDRIHVGYIEGWLANWSSPFVSRGYENGSITAVTFQATNRYGRHPAATLFYDRLIEWLS